MEDLNNIEGIGMDRAETPTPKKKSKVVKRDAFEEKVINMSYQFNSNIIAAMLMIPKARVEEIINK